MSEFEHCPKFSCFLIMTPPLTEKLRDILQERESAILNYLRLSCDILCYIRLSRIILGYLLLSQTFSGYFGLSRAISDYLCQLSSIKVQVEAGESKLYLVETIPFFFLHKDL